MLLIRRIPIIAVLIASAAAMAPAAAFAQGRNCAQEATDIRRAEAQLPRVEVAPPADKQILCITLETNILFARRHAAHVGQCPRSPLARNAAAWQRTGAEFAARFQGRRCKPTIRGYRG